MPQHSCDQCGKPLSPEGFCSACLLRLGMRASQGEAAVQNPEEEMELARLKGQFPQLEIRRLIGRGGMGAIYQARQTSLDREVALKVIAREISGDLSFIDRFEREAKALAKLSHPNIVAVHDFGRTQDGTAFLLMEYVDGVNLREAISTKSIGADDALEVIATMCRALDYAHSKGVVHRDIKPENVLLGEDGSLKIADFGIAKIVDPSRKAPVLTATRQVLGSPHYLAPEQLEAPEEVDHRVDLYALGVIFYELLTGHLPIGNFEAPSSVVHRLDKRFDAIVMKTLQRKPQLRYQNASQLESDLSTLKGQGMPLAASSSIGGKARAVSVPFTCESFHGLAQTSGLICASPEGLRIEYRTCDTIIGTFRSAVSTLDLPLERLTSVELRHGFFSSRFMIAADSLSALGNLPVEDGGRASLIIKREDRDLAEGVIQAIQAPGSHLPFSTKIGLYQELPRNALFAVMMIVLSILNGGLLSAVMVTIAKYATEQDKPIYSVIAAVTIGTVVVLQLTAGIMHLARGATAVCKSAAILSLLPIAPAFPISMLVGLWYLQTLQDQDLTLAGARGASSKGWGATTLMYLRESRTARWASILNALGIVLLAAGLIVFYGGYYPSSMRFRIIADEVEGSFKSTLQRRLFDLNSLPVIIQDGSHLTLRSWKRDRAAILKRLQLDRAPKIVWLIDGQAEVSSSKGLPIVESLRERSFEGITFPSDAKIPVASAELPLSASDVKGVRIESETPRDGESKTWLVLDWNEKGRESIDTKFARPQNAIGVGLVVDGVIEGVAPLKSVSVKSIQWQMSERSQYSTESILSAIRGPDLPHALELLP